MVHAKFIICCRPRRIRANRSLKAKQQKKKKRSYYQLDENEDEIFDLAREKLMTFISFWYFSQNASEEDFSNLEKDLGLGRRVIAWNQINIDIYSRK